MPEMPHPGEDHRYAVLVRRLYRLVVLERAARLDNGRDSVLRALVHAVTEREEGVGCEARALCREQRLHRTQASGVHPGHLARAYAYNVRAVGVYYSVRL